MRAIVSMAISVASLLTAWPAVAQSPAAPTAEKRSDLIDPLRLAAAREMLAASRVVRNAQIGAMIGFEDGFKSSTEQSGLAKDEEMTAAIRKAGLAEMEKAFNVLIPQMIEDFAHAYSQKMTLDEMKAATAFYLSPAGQKLLDLLPGMAAEANGKMQERLAPYLPKIAESAQQAAQEILARRANKGSPL